MKEENTINASILIMKRKYLCIEVKSQEIDFRIAYEGRDWGQA